MRYVAKAIATGALVFLAINANAARAQTSGKPAPPVSEHSADLIDTFEYQVEAERNALGIPGLSIVVLKDGEVITARGFGYADVDRKIPATADTLYHLASVTKTFAAILVLQLVEQGKISLDDPVSRYTTEIKGDAVKIRHLLSHTSDGTPGEKFNYNPDRFEHLTAVLEKTTGKPVRQLIVETFLDPLGMRDSVPSHDVADDDTKFAMLGQANLVRYRENLKHFAQPYTHWGDGEILFAGYPPREFWISAGLLSTVLDMAKYDKAVDRHQLLKAETLAMAWQPVRSSAGKQLEFGTGWYVTDYRGERLVWHYGHWGTGFSALYLKVPARRLTLIAFANSEALADHPYKLGGGDVTNNLFACDFINTFIPEVAGRGGNESAAPTTGVATDCDVNSSTALSNWRADRRAKARKAIALEPSLAAAYAGRYEFSFRVVTVTEEGGRLYIDVPPGGRSELFAESSSKFFLKIRPWTLSFVKNGSQVTRLDILDNGQTVSGRKLD